MTWGDKRLVRHRYVVAAAFRGIGFLIGVPSLVLLVVSAPVALTSGHVPMADTSEAIDIHTYGLVALLVMGARGVASVFGLAIAALDWAVRLLAVLALICTMGGVLLYLIGRGLQRRAVSARALAMLVVIGCAAITLAALSVLPRNLMLFDWLLTGGMAYSLWVLARRFD